MMRLATQQPLRLSIGRFGRRPQRVCLRVMSAEQPAASKAPSRRLSLRWRAHRMTRASTRMLLQDLRVHLSYLVHWHARETAASSVVRQGRPSSAVASVGAQPQHSVTHESTYWSIVSPAPTFSSGLAGAARNSKHDRDLSISAAPGLFARIRAGAMSGEPAIDVGTATAAWPTRSRAASLLRPHSRAVSATDHRVAAIRARGVSSVADGEPHAPRVACLHRHLRLARRATAAPSDVVELRQNEVPRPRRAEMIWRNSGSGESVAPQRSLMPDRRPEAANVPVHAPRELAPTQPSADVRSLESPEALRRAILDNATTERLAEDVLRRVDQRLRIERERRGL